MSVTFSNGECILSHSYFTICMTCWDDNILDILGYIKDTIEIDLFSSFLCGY